MKDKLMKSKQILTININMDGASASLYLYLDDSSTIYLSNLKVRKQYRRQGFGRKLLEMQEQIGISLNATTFCLWVQKGSWMHDWFIRRGYSDFNLHERKGFVWMIKNINQIEDKPKSADIIQKIEDYAQELMVNRDYYSRAYIIGHLVEKVKSLINK